MPAVLRIKTTYSDSRGQRTREKKTKQAPSKPQRSQWSWNHETKAEMIKEARYVNPGTVQYPGMETSKNREKTEINTVNGWLEISSESPAMRNTYDCLNDSK